jgi:hypothetical protein
MYSSPDRRIAKEAKRTDTRGTRSQRQGGSGITHGRRGRKISICRRIAKEAKRTDTRGIRSQRQGGSGITHGRRGRKISICLNLQRSHRAVQCTGLSSEAPPSTGWIQTCGEERAKGDLGGEVAGQLGRPRLHQQSQPLRSHVPGEQQSSCGPQAVAIMTWLGRRVGSAVAEQCDKRAMLVTRRPAATTMVVAQDQVLRRRKGLAHAIGFIKGTTLGPVGDCDESFRRSDVWGFSTCLRLLHNLPLPYFCSARLIHAQTVWANPTEGSE